VNLVDEHGLTTKNPAVYPIQLTPDQAPRISIIAPKRNDELVTGLATVDIGFDASDDYGISQVLLHWRSVDPDGNQPGAAGDGLAATYFQSAKFDKPMFKRVDGEISFDWNANSTLKEGVRKGANMDPAGGGGGIHVFDRNQAGDGQGLAGRPADPHRRQGGRGG
jgi:hypothetical protein